MENVPTPEALRRVPTGTSGFDEITDEGLPRRGVTLVLGGAGAGKTIFGMQVVQRRGADPDSILATVLKNGSGPST